MAPHPTLHVYTGLVKAEDKARVHRSKKLEGPGPEDMRKKVPATSIPVSKEIPTPVTHPAPGGSHLTGTQGRSSWWVGSVTQAWGPAVVPKCFTQCPRHPGALQACEALTLPPGGPEEQWQRAIHERGEAICPTCNVVTRKTLVGLKKHMEVCQKVRLPGGMERGQTLALTVVRMPDLCPQLQDALKCQHCRKQFKSKAGLNYHTMAEHSAKVCSVAFGSPVSPDT